MWSSLGQGRLYFATADEANVDERLQLQLWDSDHETADDEIGLQEIMHEKRSKQKT
jgi:hypothetical protein